MDINNISRQNNNCSIPAVYNFEIRNENYSDVIGKITAFDFQGIKGSLNQCGIVFTAKILL